MIEADGLLLLFSQVSGAQQPGIEERERGRRMPGTDVHPGMDARRDAEEYYNHRPRG